MIVAMKRLTLVALGTDAEASLDALGALGVVHLLAESGGADAELDAARDAHTRADQALSALARPSAKDKAAPIAPTADSADPARLVEAVHGCIRRRKDLQERLHALRAELARVAPLGEADPDAVAALAHKGVHVQLFTCRLKARDLGVPDSHAMVELGRDKERRYLVLVGQEPFQPAEDSPLQPFALPERSVADLREAEGRTRAELDGVGEELAALAPHRETLAEHVAALAEKAAFLEARAGMESTPALETAYAPDSLVHLTGWLPEESVAAVKKQAASSGWAFIVEDPGPDDEPPTYLKNPAWARPIEVVLKGIGVVPGYWEVDISPAFLIFLTLFFAMLVGDAGYGALFLAATALARAKLPGAPRDVFRLLTLMSLATMAWGVVTGAYFGIEALPGFLQVATVDWLGSDQNLMFLCFAIAAVHLSLAHVWNIIRYAPSLRALAQLGWLGVTWVMFFAARTMVLMQPFPQPMFYVLGAGVALIVLFMVPPSRLKTEWVNFVMLPLDLVGNFVDVVSYVRLFAVGAATFAVAAAFNAMAADMLGGLGPVIGGLVGAVILFLGHGLNILLACMGVLVHGVRLNTLEFAGHMELRWSGKRYEPFSARAPREE